MKLAILLGLIFSASAFAHSHNEFVGNIKGSHTACSLEVEQIYFENNIEEAQNLRVEVRVELGHDDHDGHNHLTSDHDSYTFILRPGKTANILEGVNGKDFLNVAVAPGEKFLPTAYALKWWHINHYHSAQCLNLKADHDHNH